MTASTGPGAPGATGRSVPRPTGHPAAGPADVHADPVPGWDQRVPPAGGPRTGGTGAGRTDAGGAGPDPDGRWLTVVMDAAFLLLLCSSLARFVSRDRQDAPVGWTVALFVLVAVVYLGGRLLAPAPVPGGRPSGRHLAWLAVLVALWAVLLALAPSATWCAMPLFFTGLHTLPARLAVPLAAALTVLVVLSELRVADGALNPNLVIAPPALAAVAMAVLVHLRRQGARQRRLIDDLVRTRRDLAETERRAGVLAERQRLSAEIHDTLAQGLSSQQMLLQAADRVWEADPEAARGHVRDAAGIAARSLAEARRFVHDLAPAELAGRGLPDALRALAERESGPGLRVAFRQDGALGPRRHAAPGPRQDAGCEAAGGPLPERVEAALLRIAQGALANVREHAAATRAALTLTVIGDRLCLDVADNGRGFAPDAPRPHGAAPDRGHGLPAMRARARQLGGTLTVESAPGEGTVVSAAVPLATGAQGDARPDTRDESRARHRDGPRDDRTRADGTPDDRNRDHGTPDDRTRDDGTPDAGTPDAGARSAPPDGARAGTPHHAPDPERGTVQGPAQDTVQDAAPDPERDTTPDAQGTPPDPAQHTAPDDARNTVQDDARDTAQNDARSPAPDRSRAPVHDRDRDHVRFRHGAAS